MTRENLITRDGRTCVWSGREPWSADLTAEHLLPRSRRGRTTGDTLAVAVGLRQAHRTKPVVAYVRARARMGTSPGWICSKSPSRGFAALNPPPTPNTRSAS